MLSRSLVLANAVGAARQGTPALTPGCRRPGVCAPEGEGGVAAAVVKLDALADAVGAAPQDEHLRSGGESTGSRMRRLGERYVSGLGCCGPCMA